MFIQEKTEILSELISSSVNKNVLGLCLCGEDELVTTAVSRVLHDSNDPIIHFTESDLHGYPVPKNPCHLSQIKGIVKFRTRFDDPVYVRIRAMRNNQEGLAA